jgi:hypothetical protein
MTVYIAQAYVAFDGATNSDAWALGQAQWVKDNLQVLTGQALVVPGTAGERSSYCVVSQLEEDGTLTTVSAWHVNDIGVITQGLPDGTGGPPPPTLWAIDTAYAVDDVVRYPDTKPNALYRCLQAHTSQVGWEPDVATSLWVAI